MKQHLLKLHSTRKPVIHWKDLIHKQDAMTALLKSYVSSAFEREARMSDNTAGEA